MGHTHTDNTLCCLDVSGYECSVSGCLADSSQGGEFEATHVKHQGEENITQTVVITTYCNEHKVPSARRFFKDTSRGRADR